MGTMSKNLENTTTKRGKSIATVLVLAIFCMIAATAFVLGALGISFLKTSMKEDLATYEEAKYQGYRTEIKSQVQTALSVIQTYYDYYQAGELTEEEAKTLAMEDVRGMRYRDDSSGYMWIDDTDYILVMHPILPEQEGNNRYDLTDPDGVKIIQSIMKTADEGGGYNQFSFTKADGVTVAPKLAYSEKFAPWNWVVTTGNYIDDMTAEIEVTEQEIEQQFSNMLIAYGVCIVIILAVVLVIAIIFGKRLARGITKVEGNLQKIKEGDLSFEIDSRLTKRTDEIGRMAQALSLVKISLADMIGEVSNASTQLKKSSEDFNEKFGDITSSIQDTEIF